MKLKDCRILSIVLFAVIVLSAVKLVGATSTLSPTATIPNISGTMAYDSSKGEIFVQYGVDYGTVSVINDSTNRVPANVTTVETYGFNGGVVYDSGKGEIFAASGDAHSGGAGTPTITAISDSNNSIVATITYSNFGNSPYNFPYEPTMMAYDSSKHEILIVDPGAAYATGNVYVMPDSNYTVGARIPVGYGPAGLVYDSGVGKVFVANTGSKTVSVISDSNNTVVANVSVGSYPSGLAYDSNKSEVFVYNSGDGTVSVISDSTNKVVANVTGIAAYLAMNTIAYDSSKGLIFAGNAVISDNTNTIVAQLPANLGDLVYDSGKGEVFADSSTGLAVFSDSQVPEFSSAVLILVLFSAVSVVVVLASKKSIRPRRPPMLTTK